MAVEGRVVDGREGGGWVGRGVCMACCSTAWASSLCQLPAASHSAPGPLVDQPASPAPIPRTHAHHISHCVIPQGDGTKTKWYDPRTWFGRHGEDSDFDEFKGSKANRDGIQSGVMSFARRLLGANQEGTQEKEEDMKGDGLDTDQTNGVSCIGNGMHMAGGVQASGGSDSARKPMGNKVAPERFVRNDDMLKEEEEEEEYEDVNGRVSDDGEVAACVAMRPHEGPGHTMGW